MKYFVKHVRTYVTTGKTRKGAALQPVAARFEHALLDDDSLDELAWELERLVGLCNRFYKGAELKFDYSKRLGYITVKPKTAQLDAEVFSMHIVKVDDTVDFSQIRGMISKSLQKVDKDMNIAYISLGEGGAL